jgi:hypothetical protein
MLKIVLLAVSFAITCPAVEISTGKMLGKGYDSRLFYSRDATRAQWRPTYVGSRYRPNAAGRFMNLRIAQALFHDEWLTEVPFNPEVNTDRVIVALDTYHEHGVLAINVSLQGGNGFGPEVPEIKRERLARLGASKGALISAFLPDGSLKTAWMARLLRLQRALDERGMFLVLMYFYEGQNGVLRNPEAIRRAVVNATDWLVRNNCRNIIIEIANEYDLPEWRYEPWIQDNVAELMELARSRFRSDFRLPISASTMGMTIYPAIREHADLTIVHGNTRSPEEKRRGIAKLMDDDTAPGPILMDEDNNGREAIPEHLAKELASCDAVFDSGGSWGYMPWRQVQMFPFRHYLPELGHKLGPDDSSDDRDQAYFREVLEHIRTLVFK